MTVAATSHALEWRVLAVSPGAQGADAAEPSTSKDPTP